MEFPLKETALERSPDAPDVPRSQRTEWNVRDSDGTLVIRWSGCSARTGAEWTIECAGRYGRPLLVCDLDDPEAKEKIVQWLPANALAILNVAGSSEKSAPGIGERAYALLRAALAKL